MITIFYKNYGLLKTRVTTGLIVLHLQCIGKDLNCLGESYTKDILKKKVFKDWQKLSKMIILTFQFFITPTLIKA